MRNHISYLKDKFRCREIELVALHEHPENIPAIANLYLNRLNIVLDVNIFRIDRAAMEILSAYTWPGNYVQFERVLEQLAAGSANHLIHAGEVRSLLQMESYSFDESAVRTKINLNRSLDDIRDEIIEQAIKENNGNKAKAARQLGISRTTLWRLGK